MRKIIIFILIINIVTTANILGQTTNYISKFSNSSGSLNNSIIFQSNNNIGIGTTTPQSKLHVEGSIFLPVQSGINIGSTTNSGTRFRLFHDSYWAVMQFEDKLYVNGPRTIFGGGQQSSSLVTIHQNSNVSDITTAALTIWSGWGTNQKRLSLGTDDTTGCSFLQSSANYVSSATLSLNPNGGNVGIGTTNTQNFKLAVKGTIGSDEITVENTTNWPDYVFEEQYEKPTIKEVENYIKEHKHLPEVPNATEVEESGVQLGEFSKILLKKIEEQMLYIIELERRISELESKKGGK